MQFKNAHDDSKELVDVPLPDNSIIVFSRRSQKDWLHSIKEDKTIENCRISLTFRYLAPFNLNSTVIIGDSNTHPLTFGDGKGKLGKWMPGECIEASRIHKIPEPQSIGPYRNIILNVGVNDINRYNRKSTPSLISEYESKCKTILLMYPKCKLFVSLLLPTKKENLNAQINEFNEHLVEMSNNYKNIFIIRHMSLVDRNGMLDPLLGRFDRYGKPDGDDYLHLGNAGIGVFVKTIKSCVLFKRQSDGSSIPSSAPTATGPSRLVSSSQSRPTGPPASGSYPSIPTLPSRMHHPPGPWFPPVPPAGYPPGSRFGNYPAYAQALTRPNFQFRGPSLNDGFQYT